MRHWSFDHAAAESHCDGYLMTSPNAHDLSGADALDLTGIRVLLVEDSWHLGLAMKRLLGVMGADVAGPAATTVEAERLLAERVPDVALVDFNLRDGERADGLIDRLHDQGVRIIVTSGYAVLPLATEKVAIILQKPIVESQLLAALRPVTARKAEL
jgi:DNA-binding NtrC family response regulator